MKLLYFFITTLFAAQTFPAPPTHVEEQAKFDFIFEKHIKMIPHLEECNPPLMVFISGSFGMGKTHTAKKLETRFKAIRLNGDDIRDLFTAYGYSVQELEDYLIFCIQKLFAISNNRMFIMDRTYDNHAEYYAQLVSRFSFPLFTIRLSVPKEVAIQRVISRGTNVSDLLQDFEISYSRYLEQSNKHFDFFLENTEECPEQNENLFRAIEEKLQINYFSYFFFSF